MDVLLLSSFYSLYFTFFHILYRAIIVTPHKNTMNTKIADNMTIIDIALFDESGFCTVSFVPSTGCFVDGDDAEINCYLAVY